MPLDSTTENRSADRVRLIIGMIVVLCCVVGSMATREDLLSDPDVWWHIKTGSWIWQHGNVPTTDPFSYTFAGQPWIAKEWLSQITYYATFALAGWSGVAALGTLVVGLAAALLYTSVSASLRPSLAASVVLVCILATSSAIVVRPHLLTLPLLVVWTHQLFDASGKARAPSYLLLLAMVAWANLHAAFTMGFIIAFFAFLDYVETSRLRDRKTLVSWLVFLALCPAVTLLHPYGYKAMLATLAVFRTNDGALPITEWQPFNAQEHVIHLAILLGLVFAALTSGFRLGFARALLLVGLAYLFLKHVRYAFYFFPVIVLVVAPVLARQFPRLSLEYWRSQPLEAAERRMGNAFRPVAGVLAGLIALAFGLQLWVLRTSPPESVAASAAIGFVKSHGVSGNVLNHYNFGGPLVFNDIPTFVDGRTDQLFLDQFGKDLETGMKDPAIFARTLEKYSVRWTITPPTDPRLKMLDALPGWKRVFSDKFAVVYQRQG